MTIDYDQCQLLQLVKMFVYPTRLRISPTGTTVQPFNLFSYLTQHLRNQFGPTSEALQTATLLNHLNKFCNYSNSAALWLPKRKTDIGPKCHKAMRSLQTNINYSWSCTWPLTPFSREPIFKVRSWLKLQNRPDYVQNDKKLRAPTPILFLIEQSWQKIDKISASTWALLRYRFNMTRTLFNYAFGLDFCPLLYHDDRNGVRLYNLALERSQSAKRPRGRKPKRFDSEYLHSVSQIDQKVFKMFILMWDWRTVMIFYSAGMTHCPGRALSYQFIIDKTC